MGLGESLRDAIDKLRGKHILDRKAIDEFIKDIQKALIAAGVDVKLTFSITNEIREKALKTEQVEGLTTRDILINLLYESLVSIVGDEYKPDIRPKRIMLIGLYGAGKTTTAAKLAYFYKEKGLKPLLITTDRYRKAAYEQLEHLAKSINVDFFSIKDASPEEIIKEALKRIKRSNVAILDTAGRDSLNEELIKELKLQAELFKPDEKILVISADIGEVVKSLVKAFNDAVGIDGIIITKMDGSAKAGGTLTAAKLSGAKVMFIGTGEKVEDLEPFNPKRYVGRLLGMPDIGAFIERVNRVLREESEELPEIKSNITLLDFYKQIKTLSKLGPLKDIASMLGFSSLPKDVLENSQDTLKKYKAMIDSMTEEERLNDALLNNRSRIERIARGSGTKPEEVKEFISKFREMKKIYRQLLNNRDLRRRFSIGS